MPPELTGGERILGHKRVESPEHERRLPSKIRPGILALLRGQPVALSGMVLCAQADATLSDFVLYVVRTPASRIFGHSVVEGLLSRSRLAPLA
jgi:hypothetical protein